MLSSVAGSGGWLSWIELAMVIGIVVMLVATILVARGNQRLDRERREREERQRLLQDRTSYGGTD